MDTTDDVLADGEKLLAELELKERARAARRRGQKCVTYTDEAGRSYSKWVREFTAR